MAGYEEGLPEWLPFAFLLSCGVLAAALWGFFPGSPEGGAGEGRPSFREHTVDLNRAGVEELTLLPGIGPRLAEAIVAFRGRHGPFRSIEELEEVKGIGRAKVSALAGWVSLGTSEAAGSGAPPAGGEQGP